MEKLYLRPDNSKYSVSQGTAFLQTKLDGGASRFRKDKTSNSKLVDVTWIINREQFEYFEAFFDTVIDEGSLPFTIDLILNRSVLGEYQAHFIPETKKLDSAVGLTFTISAQLEVIPSVINDSDNLDIIAMYVVTNEFGVDNDFLNLLEKLVNVDLNVDTGVVLYEDIKTPDGLNSYMTPDGSDSYKVHV